jgi:hypothetical protein
MTQKYFSGKGSSSCGYPKDGVQRLVTYYYYNSEDIVPDSLRNKISNTLLKYQTDTTFLYQGDDFAAK